MSRKRSGLAAPVGIGVAIAVIHLAGSHHALAAVTTATAPAGPVSGNVALAQSMAAQRGWTGSQWSCLDSLWTRESGFITNATYPSTTTPFNTPASSITTAYGIPQSLPAQQMASAGPDWQTNPRTQIRWGLTYIEGRYHDPCTAWAHEVANSWY